MTPALARRLVHLVVVLAAGVVAIAGPALRAQGLTVDAGVHGRPILVVESSEDPFGGYYAEILRAEGLNAFVTADVSTISASMLSGHDVVILAAMPLTPTQVAALTAWVGNGGNLIAMRPRSELAPLLGLGVVSSTLTDAYLRVDTNVGPGAGIVGATIQFHGTADLYEQGGGARAVATLYSDASTTTAHPAVTVASVGAHGGQAAAFTYDLARSIVYTRQGNPAWSGQERDGLPPIRPNDLFFGAAAADSRPDWIDLAKVAIPQGDEQQRLLANLVLTTSGRRKPLPRFWYFPNLHRAVIVMTGDDHGRGGTAGRFDLFWARSPRGCEVAKWECIRSTSYIYTQTPLSEREAAAYAAEGFEIALHVSTECLDYTPSSLQASFSEQLRQFRAKYAGLAPPSTIRTHCGPWSDYATHPRIAAAHGIRLDTNYYYWPGSWIADRPGMFTGSGMPMRFVDAGGRVVDVYQAPTQLTDESEQSYPRTVEALLDNALGPAGFFGAFTVNAHTDGSESAVAEAVLGAALARGVPIVSARQLLAWLDARNASSFDGVGWNGADLVFRVNVDEGARGLLTALLPTSSPAGILRRLARNETPVAYTVHTVKGVTYAAFPAVAGAYRARFAPGAP